MLPTTLITRKKIIFFILLSLLGSALFGQSAELVLPVGHGDWVNAVCFTRDGEYIITGGNDYTAKLWEIKTGKEIRSFVGHTERALTSLAVSPDGRYLLTGCKDSTARLWDIQTGVQAKIFRMDSAWVNGVAFSPDGKTILVGGGGYGPIEVRKNSSVLTAIGYVFLYDLATGKLIRRFTGHKDDVDAVAFSPDGRYIATAGGSFNDILNNDNIVRVWEVSSGKEIKEFPGHTKEVFSVNFSKDGKYLVSGSMDSTARIWDLSSGKALQKLVEKDGFVSSAVFSPDGNLVATGSRVTSRKANYSGNEVHLWDCRNGKLVKLIHGYPECITSVAFSKDGRNLLAGGFDGSARMWDIAYGKEIRVFKGHTTRVNAVAFSPDGRYLAVGTGVFIAKENCLKVWDLRTCRLLPGFEGKMGMLSSVCFSPNGKYILTGSSDQQARLYETSTQKLVGTFSGHTGDIVGVALSADGNYALTSSMDNTARIWDVASGKTLHILSDSNFTGIHDCFFSPDSKKAYTLDKQVSSWDVKKGNLTGKFTSLLLECASLSPDGTSIMGGEYDGTVHVLTTENMKETRQYKCHSGLHSLLYSPDGHSFATVCYDGSLISWDARTGLELINFKGHRDIVNTAGFSPDGRYLASGSRDNTTKIWDAATGKETVSLIAMDKSDWSISTPDNYYSCSKDALDIMAFKVGSHAFPLEQFDMQYNRPDRIVSTIGLAPRQLIDAYKAAYDKRLKQLHFSESMFAKEFHTPEIELVNAANIPLLTAQDAIKLTIKAVDSRYKIDRLNIYVDDVPLFGMNGMDVTNYKADSVQKDTTILLSQGINHVSYSCTNEKGVQSLRGSFDITYENRSQKNDLYIVAIGASRYLDSNMNLEYSVKDGKDLTDLYLTDKSHFNNIHIYTFFNEKATTANVLAVRQKLQETKVDDEVILYASGHGLLDDNLDFYFAMYDMDFEKPGLKGLPYSTFENLVDGIPARKRVILIDACHSGEVDKEGLEPVEDGSVTLKDGRKGNVKKFTYKGVRSQKGGGNLDLTNSLELMQELFANLSQGTGAVVISASAGSGYALESPEWNNGVFTYCVMNGLKNKYADLNNDGLITINELKEYVSREVEVLTKGAQKPTSRRENISYDFNVW
jgi:WD40 repeat protein